MNKEVKRYSFFASMSGIFAIVIAVLFFLQTLATLDLYTTVNFVSYFVGLAFIFTGMYCHEKDYNKTKHFAFFMGTLFILFSIAFLIYGYISGNLSFSVNFWWL